MKRSNRYLYFVRHGQYRPSPDGGILTSLGRKQATRTGKRLSGLPFDAVVVSDLNRAVETHTLAAASMPDAPRAKRSALLREARPSAFPGIHVSLEDRADGKARILEILARYFRPSTRDRYELYVCHGNLIRTLVGQCLGQPWTVWKHMGTSHCGITRFEIRPDGRKVVASYNDTGHLPHGWITST